VRGHDDSGVAIARLAATALAAWRTTCAGTQAAISRLQLDGRFREAEEPLRAVVTAELRPHATRSDLFYRLNHRQHLPQEYRTRARRQEEEVSRARSFCLDSWARQAKHAPLPVTCVSGDLRSNPVALFLRPSRNTSFGR